MRIPMLLIAAVLTFPLVADVRPISPVEREAVRVAVDYLAYGPSKVAERLAPSSPLRKLRDVNAEIEVRLGPRENASWKLQTVVPALRERMAVFTIVYPSGIDESVTFELEPETRLVRDIRILAQRAKTPQLFTIASVAPAEIPTLSRPRRIAIAAAMMALGSVLAAILLVRRRHRLASRAVLMYGMVVVIGAAVYVIPRDERFVEQPKQAVPKKKADESSLAALLPLRRALAGSGDVEQVFRTTPRRGAIGEIAKLWKAQADLQQTNIDAVKRALHTTVEPEEIPLATILRARLALHENDDATSVMAYESAISLGPGRDALWYEAAESLMALGFDERAAGYLRRLEKIGSREADVYYALAMVDASKRREEQAAAALRKAWSMRPVQREELVRVTPLWPLLREGNTRSFIDVSSPDEARFATPPSEPMIVPLNVTARVSGELVQFVVNGEQPSDVTVPGGAALAPAGATPMLPSEWAREEDERALKDLPNLLPVAQKASAFAQPALRHRITRAATALSNRNRWSELAQLTEGLTPRSEHVPSNLFFLRDTALRRLGRIEEAKTLLAELAASKVLQRKNDAQALETLAEKLASLDYYDAAIRMYDRAQAIRENPYTDDRVRQLQMNKRLATRYSTQTTPYFEIHYPSDVSATSAETIGRILEAEHTRLQKWIGEPLKQRMVVNVVWWRDFRATYTGSDFIVGFFTNKITVPFAGIEEFTPLAVSILSHELMHAMLTQATNDQAPRWFHEGLAQRIEGKTHSSNPYAIATSDRLVAMSLVDDTMRSSPYPAEIANAYAQSEMAVQFLEAQHGVGGIRQMIAAFRNGATSDEAMRAVHKTPLARFDHELRDWARTNWGADAP